MKVRAAQTGIDMQVIAETALEQSLAPTHAGSTVPAHGGKLDTRRNIIELPISKLHERWYADLTFILREGRADDTSTLKSLIEYFIRQIRERGIREGDAPGSEAGSPEGDNPGH